jgi:hypothetical protein
MAKKAYRLLEDSVHDRFFKSRKKIRIFGGGFANGKTTALVMLTLTVAKDYPGANILLARSTYPKLNDTLRRVFFEWCPKNWIKRFSRTENTVEFTNGTIINFRYIAQQGGDEHSSSNLLSATYDFIGVDQVEDPEISAKDFDDLLGRMRGDARYIGDDPSMPETGPRWMALCCNPARNWVYRKLVKPLHEHTAGRKHPDLLVDVDTGEPLIDLIEGSTYENKDNLPADFIKTLEATYQGQMRDRFLLGQWAAYEGLIYPQFDPDIHLVPAADIEWYLKELRGCHVRPTFIEGYDYGIVSPSCYLLSFVDHRGNICVLDGFYAAEKSIEWQASEIKRIRRQYGVSSDEVILADPSIFRRTGSSGKTVGLSVAGMFAEYNVDMKRGNNDIINGITKVRSYLQPIPFHKHPIFDIEGMPHLYFNQGLTFIADEISEYYWKKDQKDEHIDKPIDRKDHACDTLKYMLSERPDIAKIITKHLQPPAFMRWNEFTRDENRKNIRHA